MYGTSLANILLEPARAKLLANYAAVTSWCARSVGKAALLGDTKMTSISYAGLAAMLSMSAVAAAQIAPALVGVPSTVGAIVAVVRPSATAAGAALPANTDIWLSANTEINTKTIKQGDKFTMSVTRDVVLGDFTVIPRGTRGVGQVSYRTGKGGFGKSAKMEFDIVDLELGGRQIPVTGHYRVEGQGNTGATVGAVVAVGVFAAFVTGHSAVIAPGTEYKAYTTSAIPVVLSAPPTPVAAVAAPAAPVLVSSPGSTRAVVTILTQPN